MASSGLLVEPTFTGFGLDENVIPPASQPPYSKIQRELSYARQDRGSDDHILWRQWELEQ